MNVAIRADGGQKLGYGHLIRTETVAIEALSAGDDVYYVTTTPSAVAEVVDERVEIIPIRKEAQRSDTIDAIQRQSLDAILVDTFDADTDFQTVLSETDVTVAVKQNYRNLTVCCDLLVYGDIFAPDLKYRWLGPKPRFRLGLDYLLLRTEFKEVAQSHRWEETVDSALITMGGSDVADLTPTVMEAFEGFDGSVRVIIGPGFSNVTDIERSSRRLEGDFELLRNPEQISRLMSDADIAVTAFGTTSYELAATGTPFVGIPVVENQMDRAAALENRGLALVPNSVADLRDAVQRLSSVTSVRKRLYQSLDGLIDGRGAQRVYGELVELSR